jgi:nucleotide-binding universal stress UspA family protein
MSRLKNQELEQAFAPVKRRMIAKHLFRYLAAGLLITLALSLLVSGISFLIPLEALWQICTFSGAALLILSLAVGWAAKPRPNMIAKEVDKMGLEEKVLTALELEDRDDEIARLQRQDAIRSLNGFDRKRISINIPKHFYYTASVLIVALVLVNLIPNPMDTVIRQRKQVQAEIEEQLEELKEAVEEELADNDLMTGEQRLKLAQLVDELSNKLKDTHDYKEALKEISKAEDELAALTDELREQNLGQLTKQLDGIDAGQALAAALNNMDSRDVEAEIADLKEQLEKDENAEELIQQLKEALQKAAEAMPDGEMKDRLASIAESLQNGQSAAAAMDELGELLSNAVNSGSLTGEVKYTLQQMRNRVARAAGQTGTEYADSSGNPSSESESNGKGGTDSGNNTGGEGNQGQGNQGGQGSGQGGQGNQSGNGQGSTGDSGQSGSGIGDGTTNQSSGQGGSGTTGSQGNMMGDENAQSTYERIYDPERLGDGGEVSHVPGQQTDSGEIITVDGGKGIGDLSGYIPYKEVYSEYRSEAMTSMERRVLPLSVQNLVRDYFDSLGD